MNEYLMEYILAYCDEGEQWNGIKDFPTREDAEYIMDRLSKNERYRDSSLKIFTRSEWRDYRKKLKT